KCIAESLTYVNARAIIRDQKSYKKQRVARSCATRPEIRPRLSTSHVRNGMFTSPEEAEGMPMKTRVATAVMLAACASTTLHAQAPADPAAEQIALFMTQTCGSGASDESTPICEILAVVDKDGSHQIVLPTV